MNKIAPNVQRQIKCRRVAAMPMSRVRNIKMEILLSVEDTIDTVGAITLNEDEKLTAARVMKISSQLAWTFITAKTEVS
ncbi:hypothetical protein Daesc_005713 [Daldinia eschscholtzii]|uniref:Uncharacterized protein n=1 Tax=Daldinia eschscholtzii TaxID=292717 RepID=A0AAX6MLA6_9PEZI